MAFGGPLTVTRIDRFTVGLTVGFMVGPFIRLVVGLLVCRIAIGDFIFTVRTSHFVHVVFNVAGFLKNHHRDVQTLQGVVGTSRGREESNNGQSQYCDKYAELFHRPTPLADVNP